MSYAHTWLGYFERNARADRSPAPTLAGEVEPALHARLALSLGRFQLGESAGGRIHAEMAGEQHAALGPALRRSVQLYIEEEWRHARELALIVRALGGELQQTHWTNAAFTACRRLLGLRTKMMTLAVAEVIGIVYYRALADGAGSAALGASLRLIAAEEARHLDFQADFFEDAIGRKPRRLQAGYRWLLRGLMLSVLAAALLVLYLDHGALLRRVRAPFGQVARASWRDLTQRRFLDSARLAGAQPPGYAWLHER